MTLTKLRNATGTMYNGYRPGAIIEVEHPETLLLAGWVKIWEVAEKDTLTLAEMSKAELLKLAEEKGLTVHNKMKNDEIRALIATALEEEVEETKINLDEASDEELKSFAQELGVEIQEGEEREVIIEKLQKAVEDAEQA